MESPSGGVELLSSYSLFGSKGRGNQVKMTSRGRREMPDLTPIGSKASLEAPEREMRKIAIEVLHNRMKIFMARESSNGENFIQPLRQIKDALERVVMSLVDHPDNLANCHTQIQNIYNVITEKLISYMPKIKQGQREMGLLIVDILCFLNSLYVDVCLTFPEVFASCLLYFQQGPDWTDAYVEIVCRLCHYVLPNCLSKPEYRQCTCLPSVLMMVLEACSSTKQHLHVTDTLMQLKRDVCINILSVITYGTDAIRPKALDLLLHYWPIPIPEFPHHSHTIYGEWSAPNCENTTCCHGNNRATMLCLDVSCAAQHKSASSTKLYMLLCPDCDSTIHGGSSEGGHRRLRLPMPLREIKPNCEFQRICSGKENKINKAVVTCYDDSCTAIQNGQPIRMCQNCHSKQHRDISDPTHIFQVGPPDPWVYDDLSCSSTMLEAVSKLIEVVPTVSELESHASRGVTAPRVSVPHIHHRAKPTSMIEVEISKKGLWLLSYYCTPTTAVRPNQRDWLIHLIALVLEWLQSYYDILQQAIVTIEEQRTSAGVAAVAAGAEGQEWVDSGLYDYEKVFSNYPDVSALIHSHVLPWIRSVCETNTDCLGEALLPELPGCAQVGRLWNKSHDSISRCKRTLTILYRINDFYREGKLPSDSFTEVFNTVMPLWLEKLMQLRSEPGKMEGLQDQFRLIFSYKKHEQGMRTFNFIWEKFRSQKTDLKQKGLFWLQDLTRLQISIPYLPHMFEDALKESRGIFQPKATMATDSASSFDIGVEEQEEMERGKKDSTGSLSGYESEPHLVSQSSMEQPDTQVVVNLNSSLARYILMLDIWLSQLTELNVPTLESEVLQKNLIKMLRKVWSANHSSHDHRDSSNICYLCHGVALWFGLATKLLEEYSRRQRESSAGEEYSDEISHRQSRLSARSVKLREIISTPLRRRKGASTAEGLDLQATRQPQVRNVSPYGMRRHSADILGAGEPPQVNQTPKNFDIHGGLRALHSGGQAVEDPNEPKSKLPSHQQASPFQRRKIAQVQSHSQFEVLTTSNSSTDKMMPGCQGEGCVEATPPIYTIFQLCITKIPKSKLHPDALLKIVSCLSVLIHKWKVLEICDKESMIADDVTGLFEILWKNLETDSSNTARTCVSVLLDCAECLATLKVKRPPSASSKPTASGFSMNLSDTDDDEDSESQDESGEREGKKDEDELLWVTVKDGLSSPKWSVRFRAVENFTTMVQFMRKSEACESDYLTFNPKVQSSLAYGFCLLVQLLVDKNSNVCTRAKYLISSIKESSLEAMKFFLKNFFYDHPAYRGEILNALSLLDSSLPELQFLSIDILTNLLRIATVSSGEGGANAKSAAGEPEKQDASLHVNLGKKASDASILSGQGASRGPSPKVSMNSTCTVILDDDPTTLKVTERILSLLLRHIANPRIDIAESMKKSQGQRSAKKGGTIIGRRSSPTSTEEALVHTLRNTIFHDLHCLPQDLRKSPVFEVFLNHMFPVLDHNIQFGKTKGLLPFVLKILCFCAAPNQSDYVQLKLEDKLQSRDAHSQVKGCPYSLSSLPPHLQAPWLRVFFVVLYKYIHDYSEVEPRSHYQGLEMLTLAQWCLQITLNTLEAEVHECPLVSLSDIQSKRPSLHRQFTVNSFTHSIMDSIVGGIPSVNIVDNGIEAVGKGKSRDPLTPVPEEPSSSQADVQTAPQSAHQEDELESKSGLCIACGRPTNEYTEEAIAVAIVALGTCCHRLPHTVSGYLVSRIIPAVARVVVPGSYSWQSSKNTADPPPGSAMSVAKHILASIITQFGDRRLFLFVFGNNYGKSCQTVFTALVHSLETIEGDAPTDQGGDSDVDGSLSQFALIKYFLEDAVSSTKDVHLHSLINLATYIDILEQNQQGGPSPIQLTRDLILWDSFCKKLKNNTAVLRDKKAMHALLRVIIILFQNSLEHPSPLSLGSYHAHTIQSFSQSLTTIIEFALYNVYCPLGGLVELVSLWYRLFQQHNHREAEKLVKLFINELRNSLKARVESDSRPRPDNFLGLIQVLLLEEAGYLGYVDSLTPKKYFAPDLKRDYETHFLPVIDALQWDFTDALNYLCARNLPEPNEMIAQLKLSLAQLVALRVQHSRVPTKNLSRLISGDPRAILTVPNSFRAVATSVQPRWQDYISAIQLLAWLLLGALCHNAIDAVAVEMKIEGSVSGQCKLLESLNPKLDVVTQGVITLAGGVLQKIAISPNAGFGYLYLTFVFASVWTVYMELYVKNSTPLIVEFWQKFIGRLTHLMNGDMEENYQREVIRSLNEIVVMRLKKISLSCYTLLVPIWREILITIADTTITIPDLPTPMETISVDMWYKESVKELVTIEEEWYAETLNT